MKMITVSVEYDDLLAITLPRNAKHFERVVVVTGPQDKQTIAVARSVPNATVYTTRSFWADGAVFNKGRAIEEAFDVTGREGWLAVMDADTLLPPEPDWTQLRPDAINGPFRRILRDPGNWYEHFDWDTVPVKEEDEWPGFCQVFFAADPYLSERPWYPTNWRHAGGSDSFFYQRWPATNRNRLSWQVLHLGEDGYNWCGRATQRLDGKQVLGAESRLRTLHKFRRDRKGGGPGRFRHEQL